MKLGIVVIIGTLATLFSLIYIFGGKDQGPLVISCGGDYRLYAEYQEVADVDVVEMQKMGSNDISIVLRQTIVDGVVFTPVGVQAQEEGEDETIQIPSNVSDAAKISSAQLKLLMDDADFRDCREKAARYPEFASLFTK